MTDIEIVESIRKEGIAEKRAMIFLYNKEDLRSKAKSIFKRYSGLRLASWEDIYHDSLVALATMIKTRSYDETRSLTNYFAGICINICKVTIRKENKEKEFPEKEETLKNIRDVQTPIQIFYLQEQKELLRAVLKPLTEKCQKALMFWAQKYSNTEIAVLMEFNNAAVAGTSIYRCKNALVTYIENNPQLLKTLKDLRWI